MKVIDTYNAIVGAAVAVLSYIFGEHWILFALFLAFNVADWITGWMKSRLTHKENSKAGWKGVLKKLAYWIMIAVAFGASAVFVEIGKTLGVDLGITTLLGFFVLASLLVNEIRSICENLVEMGVDVPKILIKGLEVADKAINKDGEDFLKGDDSLDELLMERYALAKERVCEIKEEKAVQMPYLDFFQKTAAFLEKNVEIMDGVVFLGEAREPRKLADAADLSIDEWKELNRDLYADILPENYKNSYGNPVYACEKLGEYGKDFSFLYAELRGIVVYAFEKRLWDITVLLELFLEVYGAFAQEEVPTEEELRGILNSYANDYCQDMIEYRTRECVDPELDFAAKIIMNSDFSDLRYLYLFGECITENELGVAAFLNGLSQEEIDSCARTYTEGYRL